jgi:hypothetical protein
MRLTATFLLAHFDLSGPGSMKLWATLCAINTPHVTGPDDRAGRTADLRHGTKLENPTQPKIGKSTESTRWASLCTYVRYCSTYHQYCLIFFSLLFVLFVYTLLVFATSPSGVYCAPSCTRHFSSSLVLMESSLFTTIVSCFRAFLPSSEKSCC